MTGPTIDRRTRAIWAVSRQFRYLRVRIFTLISNLLLDNKSCGRLRAMLLRLNGAQVGKNCSIRSHLQVTEGFDMVLGDEVFINAGCYLDTAAPIRIGNRVQISFQVSLITGNHAIGPHESRAGDHTSRPIIIEDGAWIGARAIILPDVRIGAGAVVGAGALVTRDVPPDTLVIGVPARVVRDLAAAENAVPPDAAARIHDTAAPSIGI